MQAQAGVHASPAVPGADGHGVAFAFGGDKPGSRGHTVMIVDGRTGDTVDSKTGNGSATFQGFTSAKDQGLLWLHAFQMTMLATDGSAAYDLATMGNVFQGVFATAKDGSRVFVGGEGGVSDWATPLPHSVDGNYYPGPLGSAFAYFAGSVTPLPMDDDRATDLVALPHDYQAYNLSQNVGAYGANPHAVDAYPHGVAVLQATGARAATGDDAADSAPPARRKRAATAAPLPVHTMPVGVAEAPHQILSKQPASGHVETADIRGYTPKQLNRRLGLTGDGSGQTVAIAIAYDYPTAKEDLNHYSQQFGLPQTCDVAPDQTDCFHFEVTYADGTKPASDANWNQEAALDIESVHAVAPKARIVLVEAKDASAAALYRAVDAAATLNPAAINNSWGMPEFSEESFYDSHCDLTNSVCVQSTGDAGHPAGYSSTNPHVLAVGGTHLELDAGGNTISESAWASGGGGLSYFEERPAYQKSANRTGRRGTPDVSFDADPHTGIAMYVTVQGQHYWMQVGGTSLSSPLWAGILSTADQLRVAHDKSPLVVDGKHGDTLHRAVYDLGDALFDVTDGSNGLCGAECTAGPGYDTATGLGSPLAGIDVALAKK